MFPTKIGVLGGGQLGRMLVEASIPLALDISILDESLEYPAAGICTRFYEGNFSTYEDVLNFGLAMDVITVEIESVNIDALKQLQAQGKKVFPQPEVLDVINDKGIQKLFYRERGIPTAPFELYTNASEILEALASGRVTYPFVQKKRVGGYDGRGVSVINGPQDLSLLFDEPSLVEKKVNIVKELAVIAARSEKGEVALFPAVEMAFHPTANLVEYLFCPAHIDADMEKEAETLAKRLAEELNIIGLLAVEFFVDENNTLVVNEMAPRPHNSGHHTIEANITSQFEQHLRILLGLPLGPTDLIMPAVMMNLLGEDGYSGNAKYEGIEMVFNLGGVYPHLYNKKITKPKRKMGHITITRPDLDEAKACARDIISKVRVISQT